MQEDRRIAATTWAETVLGPIELHRLKLRPWAATWRAERPGRPDVFLKCSTAHTGHEAALLTVLSRVCPDLVPELVAADPQHYRLIVASAGSVLRELSGNGTFDLAVWVPLVARFAELQRRIAPSVNEVLAQGVPDERPERYPELLRAFTRARQLPGAERDRLKLLADDWDTNGTGLAASLIPLSIQHGDLHDNNVAVDADGVSRFFDFGDSTVAHPFSTMDLPLLFAREGGVDEAGIARLEDAYLDAFTEFAPLAELRRELHAVVAVAPLQRAHNWARALAPDTETVALEWDPVAAAEWDQPIEYWLGRL
jgi:hypothetical protein